MLATFFAQFVLFLREGLEASLIISLLFAALRQLDQMRQARAVWIGIVLAIIGSVVGGLVIYFTVHQYGDNLTFKTIFETATYIVAVVLLTTMTFWMQQHSRTMKKEIMTKASTASSGLAFGLIAFSSVGREGLESAFFTVAFAFQANPFVLLSGALAGLLASIGLCVLIYRLGYRLDFRLFFRVMGLLLLFFAGGLLGDAILNLQQLGWLPFGTQTLWNTSQILEQVPYIDTLRDLLHGLVGYTDAPTILQSTCYIAFLLITGSIFARMTRKPTAGPTSHSASTSSSAATG